MQRASAKQSQFRAVGGGTRPRGHGPGVDSAKRTQFGRSATGLGGRNCAKRTRFGLPLGAVEDEMRKTNPISGARERPSPRPTALTLPPLAPGKHAKQTQFAPSRTVLLGRDGMCETKPICRFRPEADGAARGTHPTNEGPIVRNKANFRAEGVFPTLPVFHYSSIPSFPSTWTRGADCATNGGLDGLRSFAEAGQRREPCQKPM